MSKGLELFKEIRKAASFMEGSDRYNYTMDSDILYARDCDEVEKELKALEIINKKGVDVGYLKTCKTLEDYNSNCWNDEEDFNKKLIQEEWDLLKGVLKNEQMAK